MSDPLKRSIHSEAEFLAHAIALKRESEERLQTMADCLAVHNNPAAGGAFQELANIISEMLGQLEVRANQLELPELAPWEYLWHFSGDPEILCMEHAHYMMSVQEVLQLALLNGQCSVDFFTRLEQEAEESIVRELARQQLAVERQFVTMIRIRIDDLPAPDGDREDLDPPHMPE